MRRCGRCDRAFETWELYSRFKGKFCADCYRQLDDLARSGLAAYLARLAAPAVPPAPVDDNTE